MNARRLTAFLAALFAVAAFAGCEIESRTPLPEPESAAEFRVMATVPPDGARETFLSSGVIFHFDRQIDTGSLSAESASIVRIDENGDAVEEVPVLVQGAGPNVILRPLSRLRPASRFRAAVTDQVKDEFGRRPLLDGGRVSLEFTTRAERVQQGRDLSVRSVYPPPGGDLFDWATFRVYFSEPIEPARAIYGENVMLRALGDDSPVPAQMHVVGTQIVIDPESDLVPGRSYELVIGATLQDAGGETMAEDATYAWVVSDTAPRATLAVELCPTLGDRSGCPPLISASKLERSIYTDEGQNTMILDSTLLGRESVPMSGRLVVELANTAIDKDSIPILIRKGQKMYGEKIEAMLGGEISTGLKTRDITATTLTDAYGFMQSSAAQGGAADGEVAVQVMLDVAINTGDSASNAQMAQNIMGLTLTGRAIVIGDELVMDTAGFGELNILGENMGVTISLGLRPPATSALGAVADSTGPLLMSVSPGSASNLARLGDPVVLAFNEPVHPQEAVSSIHLADANGDPVSANAAVDGGKVTLKPRWPMDPDSEYVVRVEGRLPDVTGNPMGVERVVRFRTGAPEVSLSPPLLGATDPGVNTQEAFPAHLPIQVYFTQLMDPTTIVLGDTVRVTDDDSGEDVRGWLRKRWTGFQFFPNEPFEGGRTYRLTITDDITNIAGIALDLNRDRFPGGGAGQPERSFRFTAAPADETVPVTFALVPFADRDGSGFLEGTETPTDDNLFAIELGGLLDPSYVSGYMIAHIGALGFVNDEPVMPIALSDGIVLYATGTSIDFSKISQKADLGPFDTGRLTIEADGAGTANVVEAPGGGAARMLIEMSTLISAEGSFIDGLLADRLAFSAIGDLSFDASGPMVANITGTTSIDITIPIVNITLPVPTSINLRAQSVSP
ncbi:Ig-like domain-containing protein [bacterium]|nr:Ig-like domain-containing protein [bacterium]